MSEHTPGPWEAGELDRNLQRQVLGGSGRLVCVCAHECFGSLVPEMESNARLIAAAPSMLKALRVLRCEHDARLGDCGCGPCTEAKAAIKEATGSEE